MMHIKTAKREDIRDIANIEKVCFSNPWSENSLAESISHPDSLFYIAKVDDITVGYMGLQIFSGEGYVTNVAVLPEYRRQGIAKALIAEAIKNDMEFITLEVRESNQAAISLYEAFGFIQVGKRPKFYRNPEEDALIMTLYI